MHGVPPNRYKKVFVVVDNLDLEGYRVKCFDLLVRIERN